MTLFLYPGNNMFNKKITKIRTLNDVPESFGDPEVFQNINFNPNDNISTTQIINYSDDLYATREISCNYCIVVNEDEEIISKWWVSQCRRIRNGQVELTLIRDVISDYYDEIVEAPSFIRKGWLTSVYDPAIYNNENMTFNQIKKSETPLYDKSGTAWWVAYISKDVADKTISLPGQLVNTTDIYDTWDDYSYSKYTQSNPFIGDYADVTFNLYGYTSSVGVNISVACGWGPYGEPKANYHDNYKTSIAGINVDLGPGITYKAGTQKGFKIDNTSLVPNVFEAASLMEWKPGSYALTGAHSESATDTFLEEDGRFLRVGGKAYKVKVVSLGTSASTTYQIPNTNIYAEKFKSVASNNGFNVNTIQGTYSSITYTAPKYYVTYEEVNEQGFTFTIPASRQHTQGVPYDIVAIPYQFCYIQSSNGLYLNNDDLARSIMNAINEDLADNEIFDIQLLPYAPLNDEFIDGRTVRCNLMSDTNELKQYTFLSSGNLRTVIIYAESADFKKQLTSGKITVPTISKDFKVANECDMYRLCSPNYNGQFEFSATKNGGVEGYMLSFTYKPYTPYIRIAPQFNRLYGRDFGDSRGLILGGDFSVSQINDAWKSYELNNKNYQVMFDRQIQNMEVNNSVAKTMDIVNAVTGTAQGAAAGAMGGAMVGGGYGAIAGAVVGGVSSAVGGVGDIMLNQKLRKEAMQFAKDQFGYQLQNIKALPYSLTKVGAQNSDFKLVPFVEMYTCTDVEKEALLNKIEWEGMSINRIGKIRDFIRPGISETGTFIQAQPIRLEIQEDSRVVEFITYELQTGVYIL